MTDEGKGREADGEIADEYADVNEGVASNTDKSSAPDTGDVDVVETDEDFPVALIVSIPEPALITVDEFHQDLVDGTVLVAIANFIGSVEEEPNERFFNGIDDVRLAKLTYGSPVEMIMAVTGQWGANVLAAGTGASLVVWRMGQFLRDREEARKLRAEANKMNAEAEKLKQEAATIQFEREQKQAAIRALREAANDVDEAHHADQILRLAAAAEQYPPDQPSWLDNLIRLGEKRSRAQTSAVGRSGRNSPQGDMTIGSAAVD